MPSSCARPSVAAAMASRSAGRPYTRIRRLAATLDDLQHHAANCLCSLRLGSGGQAGFVLVADQHDVVTYVAGTLAPYVLPETGPVASTPGETVRIVRNRELHAELQAHVRTSSRVHLDGRWVVPTSDGAGYVTWRDDTPDATIVVLDGVTSRALKAAGRTVRGISKRLLVTDGWAPVHAGCADIPGAGPVLLIGPRGAGKTTTLLHLLAADPPATFVANSEVLLARTATGVVARGTPLSIALRQPTLDRFPSLATPAPRWAATPLQWEHPPGQIPTATNRLLVPPAELAAAFGATVAAEARPLAVVVVNHQGETTSAWHKLTPPAAEGALAAALTQPWLPDNLYEQDRINEVGRPHEQHRLALHALAHEQPAARLQPGADPAAALRGCLHVLLG